jgi:hypothetical protein
MLFRRSSSNPERKKASGEFALFKPLFVVAVGAILFELLPLDFQHFIAPGLVSCDEVFYASRSDGDFTLTREVLIQERLVLRQDETVMTISIN